jgi:hypothetical protein
MVAAAKVRANATSKLGRLAGIREFVVEMVDGVGLIIV